MSTATLSRSDRMNVALFSGSAFASDKIGTKKFRKGGDPKGVLVVQRKPVFRTGTFRDSMGEQSTWEPMHLDMMKNHFDMLRVRNILKDIPVRDGHPGWLMSGQEGSGKVIGWHTNLIVEEIEIEQGTFSFLLADYELTDPEAAAKEENGTYRNRSSEIGEYRTNDEATFWPVYMGVAMVDFSAVEGLNFSKFGSELKDPEGRVFHVFMDEREAPQVGATDQQTAPPVAPPPPVVVPPVQQHQQAPVAQPHVFKINGADTSDFAAVQAHIASLEAFQTETRDANITAFVNGLATDAGGNKLLASQIEPTLAWAKTLSGEQFTAWKATQEAAPAHPVVGQQFANFGSTDQGATGDATSAQATLVADYERAKDTVTQHKRSGMSPDQIEKTASYKKMVELEPKVQAASGQGN